MIGKLILRPDGLTLSGARRTFGFEKMAERSTQAQMCIKKAEEIRSCEELPLILLKALMSTTDSFSDDVVVTLYCWCELKVVLR